MQKTLRARLESHSDICPVTGCWLWQSSLSHNGYGRIKVAGRQSRAHRVSYELYIGPIPDGLQMDHLCRTPSCINPHHVEPVTLAENVRRSASARRQLRHKTCRRGHDNWHVDRSGTHRCRTCHQEAKVRRLCTDL